MPKKRNWREPTVYSTSRTIPGQSLLPSELLKRHLAGTLPDIDLSQRYEYHYDENGAQIGEAFPIEMHELHKLALRVRKEREEEINKMRAEKAKKFRDDLIEQYKKEQSLAPKTITATEEPVKTFPKRKGPPKP